MVLSWTWPDLTIGVIVFLLTFFGTIVVVAFVLVRLPTDYFAPRRTPIHDWLALAPALGRIAYQERPGCSGRHDWRRFIAARHPRTRVAHRTARFDALGHTWKTGDRISCRSDAKRYCHDQ